MPLQVYYFRGQFAFLNIWPQRKILKIIQKTLKNNFLLTRNPASFPSMKTALTKSSKINMLFLWRWIMIDYQYCNPNSLYMTIQTETFIVDLFWQLFQSYRTSRHQSNIYRTSKCVDANSNYIVIPQKKIFDCHYNMIQLK